MVLKNDFNFKLLKHDIYQLNIVMKNPYKTCLIYK